MGGPLFVRVAEEELTRIERCARAGRRHLARTLDDRLRQTVSVAKVFMGILVRRSCLQVQVREDLHAGRPVETDGRHVRAGGVFAMPHRNRWRC